MEILNEIIKLQKEGFSDEDIYNRLRSEGISPKQIKDAVNQARVKSAVYASEEPAQKPLLTGSIMDSSENQNIEAPFPAGNLPPTQSQEYYPEPAQTYAPQSQIPSPQDYPPQENTPAPQDNYEGYYPQTPQGYSPQNYYSPQGSTDTQTISEIAEQIVSEKISEFKKEIGDVGYFQRRAEEKISDIDERLKKIENTIDRLQQAIIEKIGEFGQSTSLIHKDLDNLHGTVSKLMNPLMDNYNELQKLTRRE